MSWQHPLLARTAHTRGHFPKLPLWFREADLISLDEHWCANSHCVIRVRARSKEPPPAARSAQLAQYLATPAEPIALVALPGLHYVGSWRPVWCEACQCNISVVDPQRLADAGGALVQLRYIQLVEQLFPGCSWHSGQTEYRERGESAACMAGIVIAREGEQDVAAVACLSCYPCSASCCVEPA